MTEPMSEVAYDVVSRETGEIVGTAYIAEQVVTRFEPVPTPKSLHLYRVVWWQSMIDGIADGETLEEDVPLGRLNERVAYWRVRLAGEIGVMVDACPMAFVPIGEEHDDE